MKRVTSLLLLILFASTALFNQVYSASAVPDKPEKQTVLKEIKVEKTSEIELPGIPGLAPQNKAGEVTRIIRDGELDADGILSGTVTGPDFGSPVEGVTITADQLMESFTTITGTDGTYELSLPAGTYEVMAGKAGYATQTVTGIVIEDAVVTTQDFMLEYAAPVLLTAEGDYFDVTTTWEGNPLFTSAKDLRTSGISASNILEVSRSHARAEKSRLLLGSNKSVNKSPRVTRGPGESCDEAVTAIEGLNSCPGAPYWYEFTPAEDMLVNISSCIDGQMADTYLVVYDACEGELVAENDDLYDDCEYFEYAAGAAFAATGGTSYKIYWDPYWESESFDFILETEAITAGLSCETAVTASLGLNSSPEAPYWFEFTPAVDKAITISSCIDGQAIDTDVEVYDACGGTLIAANDDLYGGCGAYQFASAVTFNCTSGVSYKIKWLSTWSSSGFDFTIDVHDICAVECPPEGIPEGEICAEDGYVDNFNGGCNSVVPIFTPVNCGDVVCGTASNYVFEGIQYRDTDWYELVIDESKVVSFAVTAEFLLVMGILEQNEAGVPGCENNTGAISPYDLAAPCEEASIEVTLAPGTYYFFVSINGLGFPCGTGNNYVASWQCTETYISYYNLYRDGEDIADVYGTSYIDSDVEPGNTYCYTVDQVYLPGMMTGLSNELCATVIATGILSGYVSDASAKGPVQGVTITAEEIGFEATTDDQGYYEMMLPVGDYSLTAVKDGYISQTVEPVTIVIGQITEQNFILDFEAPVLLSATSGYFDVTLEWQPNPLFVPEKGNSTTKLSTSNEMSKDLVLITKEKLVQNKPLNKNPKITRGPGESCAEAVTAIEGLISCEGAPFWYEFTPSEDLMVTISSCIENQMADTYVLIYDACEGELVAENDDLMDDCVYFEYAAGAAFAATGGTSYKIFWDPYWESDPFDFTLTTEVITAGATCEDPATAVEGLNSCPGAPFWYEFTPTTDAQVTISSCLEGQILDTKVWVYDACDGNLVAYNDDLEDDCPYFIFSAGVSFPAYGGTSYKIFWDPEWDTPPHDFIIETGPLCDLPCPDGAVVSAEPCPTTDYIDTYNGGCNAALPVFEPIACGETICGTAATYTVEGENRRDTDWYELTLDAPKTVTFSGMAEFPVVIGLAEQIELGLPGCENITGFVVPFSQQDPCMEASISVDLPPGTYYFFVGMQVFEGYPCDGLALNDYYVSLTCEDVFLPYVELIRDGVPVAEVWSSNTYVDMDVTAGEEYCYYINEHLTPAFILGPSNTLCATVPYTPIIGVNPGELFESLDPGGTSMQTLTIDNSGLGDLDWEGTITFLNKALTPYGEIINPGMKDPNTETGTINEFEPFVTKGMEGSGTDGIGEILYDFDIQTAANTDLTLGANFDGEFIWTIANVAIGPNMLFKWDLAGNLLASYDQGTTSIWGMRDMAFDEATGYLYAGDNDGFYQIDPADGTVTTLFTGTVGLGLIQALAHVPGLGFVANNGSSAFTVFDISGNILGTLPNGFVSGQGLAYDHYNDCLWFFSANVPGTSTAFYQYDYLSATPGFTGLSYAVPLLGGNPSQHAGGAFFTTDLVTGAAVLGGSVQGVPVDWFFAMDIGTTGTSWLSITPTAGMLPPSGNQMVDVMFNANSLDPGIYYARINFNSNDPFTPEIVVPVQLMIGATTQNIMMPLGWSLISSYRNPDTPQLETLFADQIANSTMAIMLGNSGIFWPGYGINTIGDWNPYEGYKVKMNSNDHVFITGELLENRNLSLSAGLSYMPILSETPVEALDIFGQVSDQLFYAFDIQDQLVYWPEGGIYTLTTLEPGRGYVVNMLEEATVTFPEVTKSFGVNQVNIIQDAPWLFTKTGTQHIISISSVALNELEPGDIIGVFNSSGLCTGMSQYQKAGENLALVVWGDDYTTEEIDGMISGEQMNLHVYSSITGEENTLIPVWNTDINPSNQFAENGVSMITSFKSATSLDESNLEMISIYPNPNNGLFMINGIITMVRLQILNSTGQLVQSMATDQSVEIDLSNYAKGIYYLKLVSENEIMIEKIIVK